MKKKAGFTLIELLIAATIIAILAVLATTSYRDSVGETRVASARTEVETVANAVIRYKMDYSTATPTLYNLVEKGLLQKGVGDETAYFKFVICDGTNNCPVASALVCLQGVSDRLPKRFRSGSTWDYYYCYLEASKPQEKLAE